MSSENEKANQERQNASDAEMKHLAVQVGETAQRLESLKIQKKDLEQQIDQEKNSIATLERGINSERQKKAALQEAIDRGEQELEGLERRLGGITLRVIAAQAAVEQKRPEEEELRKKIMQQQELQASVASAREESRRLEEALAKQKQANEDLHKAIRFEIDRAAGQGKLLAEHTLSNHPERHGTEGRVRSQAKAAALRERAAAPAARKYVLDGDITGPDDAPAAHDEFKVLSAATGRLLTFGKTDASGHIHIPVSERDVIVEVDGVRYPQQADPVQEAAAATA